MDSIVQGKLDVCPVCFRNINERCGEWHHIYNGTANRKKSEEDGMKIYVHHECHMEIHAKQLLDLDFKARYQPVWCEYHGKTVGDFIKRYGKNYIEAFHDARGF